MSVRILELREVTKPISSPIRNAYIDFTKMTSSLVAVVTDVVKDGRRVVGYGFNSNGRYGQGGLIRERFANRILQADPKSLRDDAGTNLDPHRIWAAMMANEKPGGHGERSVAVGTIDMAVWDATARTGTAPLVCVMTADRPQKTVSEVVSAAKADPGNWNFAISATGSAGHLATIDFLQRTGATIPMVAYRGTQPALLDVMTGAVQLLIDASFALLPAAKDGTKVRALGIAEAQRSVLAPDIPTLAEQGLPGFAHQSWYAVWAPKGMPREIQAALNALVQDTMRDPAVVAKLTETLLVPVAERIDQTKIFIRQEIARAHELLQSVNFEPT